MWFDDLDFQPHRRADRYPGKVHARATLPNGAEISVVFTPEEPNGPDDEPYEVRTSALDGSEGDGIFHCHRPEDVQRVMNLSALAEPSASR